MSGTLGDCEAVGDGLLAQPANSLSSLAFLAVGAWLLRRATAQPAGARWPDVTLAVALAANGIGSLWYHGHPDDAGHWLHDVAAFGLLAVLITMGQALRVGRGPATALTAAGAMLVVLGLVEVVWPDRTNQWVLFFALFLAMTELQAGRFGETDRRPTRSREERAAAAVLVVSLLLAAMGFVLGRSGSAACRTRSAWQFHGLWHAMIAVAAGAYAVANLEPRARAAIARRETPVTGEQR